MVESHTCAALLIIGVSMTACGEHNGAPDLSGPHALWQREVTLFRMQVPNNAEWREHRHLRGRFLKDYPDDIEVLFLSPSGGQGERMWVKVIAEDSSVDLFLGVLLNSPDIIGTVAQGENVCFVYSPPNDCLLAVTFRGEYRRAGLPNMEPPSFFSLMAQGLRWYRLGNFGHNPSALDSAVVAFCEAKGEVTSATEDAGKFYLHFYLGRCYAEQYETLLAVQEFDSAIQYRPDDEHAHMGLLAELSVLVNRDPSLLPGGTLQEWETRFVTEAEVIKSTFPPTADCVKQIDAMRSKSDAYFEANPNIPGREIADGWSRPPVFRWKCR